MAARANDKSDPDFVWEPTAPPPAPKAVNPDRRHKVLIFSAAAVLVAGTLTVVAFAVDGGRGRATDVRTAAESSGRAVAATSGAASSSTPASASASASSAPPAPAQDSPSSSPAAPAVADPATGPPTGPAAGGAQPSHSDPLRVSSSSSPSASARGGQKTSPVPPPRQQQPPPSSAQAPPPGCASGNGGPAGAFSPIAGTAHTACWALSTEATADDPARGGGQDLSHLADGAWAEYRAVDFGGGATQFYGRVASGAPAAVSGLVQVHLDRLDSPPIGSFSIAATGGWQNWRTVPANIAPTSGVHDVYISFDSGQPLPFVSLHWLDFGP
ncbi:MAG: carbohydrate-binding protein [Catenulispora sp.]